MSKLKGYREVEVPHCGTCRHFCRDYEDAFCNHPLNFEEPYDNFHPVIPDEGKVCDMYEMN